MEPVINPGPLDTRVLRKQGKHRSQGVWRGDSDRVLSCREHMFSLTQGWKVHEGVLRYMCDAGFYGVHRLQGGGISLNRALLTSLIERWRQETHTFHLAVGEATITLQDVAVLLGLRVDGDAVMGSGSHIWADLVEDLLGIRPYPDNGKVVLEGMSLKLSWLK